MKKLMIICVLLLMFSLVLSGCDLRNRMSSEYFIETGDADEYAGAEFGDPDVGIADPAQTGMGAVKTVLSESGEYLFTNPEIVYSYELPFIDLAGGHAVSCNQDIEASFGRAIRESLEEMEQGQQPTVRTVSYMSYVFGNVLTVRIERADVDGGQSEAIFSVEKNSGERVTTNDFCDAVGMSRDQLKDRLDLAVEERLLVVSQNADPEDPEYLTALNRTKAELGNLDNLNLYLDPGGSLICIVHVYSASGGDGYEELRVG